MSGLSIVLLISHVAATWYLVGLCWLVQRVQYPLMSGVGAANFGAYEAAHVARIAPIVGPAMVVEFTTGIALLTSAFGAEHRGVLGLGFALIVMIWASTFLVQVPLHGILTRGFDGGAHASLVRSNWFRTVAWTARGVLVAFVLGQMLATGAP